MDKRAIAGMVSFSALTVFLGLALCFSGDRAQTNTALTEAVLRLLE